MNISEGRASPSADVLYITGGREETPGDTLLSYLDLKHSQRIRPGKLYVSSEYRPECCNVFIESNSVIPLDVNADLVSDVDSALEVSHHQDVSYPEGLYLKGFACRVM